MDWKIVLGSVVRGGVQVVAGFLASKGIIDAAGVTPFIDTVSGVVVGGLIFAATLVWSLISKQKALDTIPPKG